MTSRPSAFVRVTRRAPPALFGAGLALLSGAPAFAQGSVIGPSKCVGCHDHSRQEEKWQREEPAQLKNKAHYNTRKALDAPEGLAYAKKLGLADTYDLKGPCVGCHSTVFRGDASAGVSCESCHGAASAYLEPHQVKGSYAKAVAAGMRDLKGRADAIARVCVACHITTDKRLLAANHPSGAGFDAGASLRKVVHFATTYEYAQVTTAGRAAAGSRPPAASAAKPPAAAVPPAAPPKSAPLPAPASGAAVATATARAAVASTPAAAAPAPEAAPWDWDQPIRPLPEDYVPESASALPAADVPPGAAAPVEPAEPAAPPPPQEPSPPRRAAPAPPLPPPSIAEEIALPLPMPGAAPGGDAVSAAVAPAPVVSAASAAAPRSPAAEVVELRGRAGALLERLLRGGARVPDLPAPTRPSEFKGPDSELLRIQDEVLALGLEALRRPE